MKNPTEGFVFRGINVTVESISDTEIDIYETGTLNDVELTQNELKDIEDCYQNKYVREREYDL